MKNTQFNDLDNRLIRFAITSINTARKRKPTNNQSQPLDSTLFHLDV